MKLSPVHGAGLAVSVGNCSPKGRYNWRVAMRAFLIGIFVGILASAALAQQPKPVEIKVRAIDLGEAAKVSWVRDIQPLLQAKCSECHSSDERKNEFEVTSVETLRTRGRKDAPGG